MSNPVGYKNPPKHTQFQKGCSGNPAGRPKKTASVDGIDLLARELDKKIAINEGGKQRKISKREALFTQLINTALKGNLQAMKILLAIMPPAEAKPVIDINNFIKYLDREND